MASQTYIQNGVTKTTTGEVPVGATKVSDSSGSYQQIPSSIPASGSGGGSAGNIGLNPATGLYGTNPNNPVTSSTTTRAGYGALGADINTYTNSAGLSSYNDASTKLLNDRMTQMKQDYDADIGGIKTAYEEAAKVQGDRQNKDYAGRSTGLVTSGGGFLGTTQSHEGVLQNLTDTFTQEKNALMSKRDAALQAARDAYNDKSFAIAIQQLNLAKDTEKELYSRQKDFADQQLQLTKDNRAQQEFDLGLTDKKITALASLSDKDFAKLDPNDIAELDKNYYPGYTAAKRAIEKQAENVKSSTDRAELDIKIANAVNATPAGRTITIDGKTYKGMKPAPTSSGKGLIPMSLASQLGVPSLAGKDESDVILSFAFATPPPWYREFYKNSDPTAYAQVANNPQALKADWQAFKAQPDITAYSNSAVVTKRINSSDSLEDKLNAIANASSNTSNQ